MKRGALALALLAAAACGEDDDTGWAERLPEVAPPVPPVDARSTWIDLLALEVLSAEGAATAVTSVEIRAPEVKETGLEGMQRSRSGDSRVRSDVRRAFALDGAGAFEIRLPRGGRVRAAFGAVAPAKGERLAAGTVVDFALSFDAGDGFRVLASASVSGADLEHWIEAAFDVPAFDVPEGGGRLRFEATPRPGSGGDAGAVVRCAFANPSLELASSGAPDVVLVSIDTLRADRLGFAGYERDTSPNLDRLAERGVVFERCISQAPWTLPSYGSLFTSLHPTEHRAGVSLGAEVWERGGSADDFEKGSDRLAEGVPTLAESLSAAGYRTCALYFNPFLDPVTGIGRGFDEYVNCSYGASAGVDRAIEWFERNEGLPSFLFLQLIDPHWPYAPPAPFDRAFAGRAVESISGYPWSLALVRKRPPNAARKKLLSDLYDGEVAYVDAELGRLFAHLDDREQARDALVVVHSDHGEELWDHGRLEHGHSLHDEVLRVPLVIVRPSVLPPGRVASTVRTIDVFPTILDLLGLTAPSGLRGSSLVGLARGEVDVELEAFAEAILWGRPYAPFDEAKALVADGFKLVLGDGDSLRELYRLEDDPRELTDLALREPEDLARMRDLLARRFAELRSSARQAEGLELQEGERERLAQIGYADDEEDDGAGDEEP